MNTKYLSKIILSILLLAFSLYYFVMSIDFDICKYTFCFKYVNIDQLFTIIISLINTFIIIYGLDHWKKQVNTNRNIEIYKSLLSNLDNLEESRCCYDLLINSFNREIQQQFDPQISLLFYEQFKQKFEETRYADISKIAKYNTYALHMSNFFPNFNYVELNEAHKKFLDILETIYISVHTKNYSGFMMQIESYSICTKHYKELLKELRVMLSNHIILK